MMNFAQAQVSALGRSIGAGLRIIADISQLQSNNYELQQTMLAQQNRAATVNAEATIASGQQDQTSMLNQAYGEYGSAGCTLLGAGVTGGIDAYNEFSEGGLKDLNSQVDALDEKETLFKAEDNRRALGLEAEVVADDGIPADQEQVDNAKRARAKGADLTKKGGLNKLDLQATSEEDYKAIKQKAQQQRKEIMRKKESIENTANSRRQTITSGSQSVGQLIDATFKLNSANASAASAQDKALAQVAQYSSGASQGAFDADSQSNSALASARDAEYQFLQAIARSNQPN